DVIVCHQTLWQGIEDRVSVASGGWANLQFIRRIFRAYWLLLRRYRAVGDYDLMVVGYPGQLDVFLARVLTWLRKKPLVLDIFMSLSLIAQERGLVKRHPFTGRMLHLLENFAYRLPNRLIQDTPEYKAWLMSEFHLGDDRFRLVPTGADDRLFHPLEESPTSGATLHVLYYGSFIPNHGVPYIMEAAKALVNAHDIMFTFIGEGPDKATAQSYALANQLQNVEFIAWLPQSELLSYISGAGICLGAFGNTPQSVMTVQNKIYECMAMRKPVVTGDSPAVRDHFQHNEQIYLVERANSLALSTAILNLSRDSKLRNHLAQGGYAVVEKYYTIQAIGKVYREHLFMMLNA
ncbi:MAG: glycosyltransferase, partial [Anaerolineales bacterium]